MAYRIAGIAALCLLAAGTAHAAAADDDRRYKTVWNIQPDPGQTGVRHVAIGDPVLEQRLLPFGLAQADEDIRSESGDVLAEKGTQLFQLMVGGKGKAYCVATVPRPSAFRSLMLGGGNLQRCFVDGDADGRFDGQFNGGNPMRGVPYISGKLPKTPKQASGRYSTLRPEQFALQYTVRIALTEAKTTASGQTVIGYRIDFGDAQTRQKLSDRIGGQLGGISILDAKWVATAIEGNGLKVSVLEAMPDQPFLVMRVVTYR